MLGHDCDPVLRKLDSRIRRTFNRLFDCPCVHETIFEILMEYNILAKIAVIANRKLKLNTRLLSIVSIISGARSGRRQPPRLFDFTEHLQVQQMSHVQD